jgi:hypothetical protein
MNYLYSQVESANFRLHTPERRAFAKHLAKVAKALHDIEWVDSCDYGPGDENAAIMACIRAGDLLATATEEARKAAKELQEAIARADERKAAKAAQGEMT